MYMPMMPEALQPFRLICYEMTVDWNIDVPEYQRNAREISIQ